MQSVMAELVLYMAHCQEQMATGCQFKETRLAKTAFEQLRANIEIRREEKAEIELIEAQQVEARMEPAIQMAKGRQDSKIQHTTMQPKPTTAEPGSELQKHEQTSFELESN